MHLGAQAQTTPDKPAYIMASTGEVVTYRQLDEASNRLAHVFADAGLVEGDSIALMLENNLHFFEVTWAAQRSGLYYTAISSRLTHEEAAYIINDCGAQAFVTSQHLAPVAAELTRQMPNVNTGLMMDGAMDGYESYEAATAAKPSTPIAQEREGADMLYSSGTTGRPKGVKAPLPSADFGQPNAIAVIGQLLYGFSPEMVYLSPAPLYHAAPLRFSMAVQRIGGTVVVMEHFDPAEFLELVARYRVSHTQVVPTMFVRMLKLAPDQRLQDVSSLRTVIHAAAPCPIETKRAMIEWWGPIIYEYYAGTEGNGFVACNSEEWLAHPGTVGKALTGIVHIVDEESGDEVAVGETGTVYFEGGANFEYHNDPEKTQDSRLANGWSTLGDIGRVDEDGFLYLTDRKAYMIISGGVNIYPQEAENLLVTHPKVMDVAVFGIPNPDFGEEVKAVVQPMHWQEAGPELERELIAFCKEHLAGIKCPRTIDFEQELPRHPTGKLYKRLLRDRYWEATQS
ncbi:MAG TPA: AMP-binding protein [Acidimicrobiales bacterium]|nr:AMP-binding protein [Acidimicrobiales bacterium]